MSLGDGSPPVTSGAAWFMGGAPVGGLGDFVSLKLKHYFFSRGNWACKLQPSPPSPDGPDPTL